MLLERKCVKVEEEKEDDEDYLVLEKYQGKFVVRHVRHV
jgi:hypothetical protein